MARTGLNHVSVVANDLEASVAFYQDVFDMEPIPTPNFTFDGQWLEMACGNQLHLFDLETPAPQYHHFGVVVDDPLEVYEKARDRDAVTDFSDDEESPRMYELPDGSLQMYVEDPDDNVIEVNAPDVGSLDETLRGMVTDRDSIVPQTGEAAEATLELERFGPEFRA
jgi:catechol 2,3-dioxygenase-like lactoylglutathione lyase family enzyme